MVVNGEMPLAYNGFYMLLPKGGLFAADMWGVRSAVCSDAFVVWGLILGWIYAEERNKVRRL